MSADHERRRTASVTAYPNGPLIVRGDVDILDAAGDSLRRSRQTVALCRCGASAIKPWCDGTHKITGFATESDSVTPAGGEAGTSTHDRTQEASHEA